MKGEEMIRYKGREKVTERGKNLYISTEVVGINGQRQRQEDTSRYSLPKTLPHDPEHVIKQ